MKQDFAKFDYPAKELSNCQHLRKKKHQNKENCLDCGSFIPSDNSQVYKSRKMSTLIFFNPHTIYKSQTKVRIAPFSTSLSSDYMSQRQTTVDFMWNTGEKLHLTLNTIHLAIKFLDYLSTKINIPLNKLQVYGATSIMLAAKAIELDERIPFISKLQKFSGLSNKQEEFIQAEAVFIKQIGWKLQNATLVDSLEYLLSQGILFSSDTLEKQDSVYCSDQNALKEKIWNIPNTLKEDRSMQSPENIKKNGKDENSTYKNFSSGNLDHLVNRLNQISLKDDSALPQNIILKSASETQISSILTKIDKDYSRIASFVARAAASVAFMRKVNGITPIWNNNLQLIADIQESEFKEVLGLMSTKFELFFQPLKKTNTIISSMTNKDLFSKGVLGTKTTNKTLLEQSDSSKQNSKYSSIQTANSQTERKDQQQMQSQQISVIRFSSDKQTKEFQQPAMFSTNVSQQFTNISSYRLNPHVTSFSNQLIKFTQI